MKVTIVSPKNPTEAKSSNPQPWFRHNCHCFTQECLENRGCRGTEPTGFLGFGFGFFSFSPYFFLIYCRGRKASWMAFQRGENCEKGQRPPTCGALSRLSRSSTTFFPPAPNLLYASQELVFFQTKRRTLQKVMSKQSEWKLLCKHNYCIYS